MGTQAITVKPLGGIAAALGRLFQSPSDTIRGVDTSSPFGPLQPVRPWIEIDEPRGWQFIPGQNLQITPRAQQQYSAIELQSLSMYPMARILIENVKDMVCRMPWQIRPRPEDGETSFKLKERRKGDANVATLTRFFERPNPDQSWSEFIRQPLEDMLTIDAPAILLRRTKPSGGKVVELRPIQGDTINRLIDTNGYTPQPPNPAYQQLWYGQPMLNLTTDQLVYKPRNILPRNLYGTSPVEQAAPWIKVGMQRLSWQDAYYSAGSIPDRVLIVPPGIPPEKIAEQQMWMNSAWVGNLWARRQWKLVQGFRADGHDQVIDTKEGALTDPFDDLIIRVLAYAFGTSPQRLLKMQNRATANANQEAAEDEGLQPWLDWVMGVMNFIIQAKMGYVDYEFTFIPPVENDILKQAQVDKIYLESGVDTRNQVRERKGDDPIVYPEMDEPGTFSPQNGFMPITGGIIQGGSPVPGTGSKKGPVGSTVPDEPIQTDDGKGDEGGDDNKPPNGKKPKPKPGSTNASDTGKTAHCRLHKTHDAECHVCLKADLNRMFKSAGLDRHRKLAHGGKISINPAYSSPEIVKARGDLHSVILKVFRRQRELAMQLAGELIHKVRKADGDNPDDVADKIYERVSEQFGSVPDDVVVSLRSAALSGASKGIAELNITDDDLINKVNEGARDWAEDRAAEMVGMRRTEEGELIPNPNAEWVIGDETRKQLRKIVSDAFSGETAMEDIQDAVKDAGAFSDYRAEMISRTEIATAQTNANYSVWKESGVVKELVWDMSEQHSEPCDCELNDGESVPIGTPFPSGDLFPPLHPNCDCSIAVSSLVSE